MALLAQHLHRSLLTGADCFAPPTIPFPSGKCSVLKGEIRLSRHERPCSYAGAVVGSPMTLAGGIAGVPWGSVTLRSTHNMGSIFFTSPPQSLRSLSVRSQASPRPKNDGGSSRRVWRRRKLSKRDLTSDYKIQRVPFLEEQVRKINEGGGLMSMDIHRLLLSEDNRFEFVNDVAAEAKEYVESNRDEYGHKKAIQHVLSNRMNDAGFYRPEAYMETDPFKPGPSYLKEEWT